MKAFAVIVLLLSTTGAGYLLTDKAKRRKEICRELIILCDMLLIDISFRNTPLTQLIENYDFRYLDFLTIDRIKEKGSIESVLNNEESNELSDFIYQLGKTDVTNQVKLIEGYKEKAKHMYEKYTALYSKNSKIYLSFGFLGGAAVSLIML